MRSAVAGGEHKVERKVAKHAAKAAMKGTGGIAGHLLKWAGRRAVEGVGRTLERAGAGSADALRERARRLPIQQSIDIAVPIDVAWEQWLEFEHLPDALHRVTDIERDGDELSGRIEGLRERDWNAEILDEREADSFAWQTTEGSDTAGLVTFHELSERLTRLELNLDAQPGDLAEAAGLALRLADRRVRTELRRFKAQAELLSPDVYEELVGDDEASG
jgi:uncharacterized membrane protein